MAVPEYFIQNPDVAAEYEQNNYGMTPEQFAAKHYELYGQKEGRAAPSGGGAGGAYTTALDPSQSTLSPNFDQYVYNMLGRAEGLASLPYQEFTGERFAGPSDLQKQAFVGIAGLQTPAQYQEATDLLKRVGQKAGEAAYTPTTFGDLYQAPDRFTPTTGPTYPQASADTVSAEYQAPDKYEATKFGNQFTKPDAYTQSTITSSFEAPELSSPTTFDAGFQAPSAYEAKDLTGIVTPVDYQAGTITSGFRYDPTKIDTGLGAVKSVEDYMSQYRQGVTDIEKREAARQSAIAELEDKARFTQAGAYGGARQAIVEAERERNLAQLLADIQTKGAQSAYDRALAQRAQESGLSVEAQRASEQGRQFGAQQSAQFGLEAQKASEQAKQFAADVQSKGVGQLLEAAKASEQAKQFSAAQGMTAAQLQAQFGLTAQQAQEAARQFNAGQAMTAEQLQAQFGLDAQKANELSRQFGASQSMTGAQSEAQYGLAGLQAEEQSKQYGYGQGMTAAQLQAQYGLTADQANQAANLQAQGMNINAALEAARQGEQSRQYGYGQEMAAAGQEAQYGLAGAQQTEQSKQFGANYGLNALNQQLAAGQALTGVGTAQQAANQGIANLQLTAGGVQQQLAQQPLDFGYQQFQDSVKDPYQKATFMQSMLQGLPLAARPYDSGQSGFGTLLQGGIAGAGLYNALNPTATKGP